MIFRKKGGDSTGFGDDNQLWDDMGRKGSMSMQFGT